MIIFANWKFPTGKCSCFWLESIRKIAEIAMQNSQNQDGTADFSNVLSK